MSEANAPDLASLDRRKLVAVIYADMVGYSRLIGLDDQGTLERLRALRRDLIDPAIEEHGGRKAQFAPPSDSNGAIRSMDLRAVERAERG